MFESEYELSYDEDNQIEQPANIYSIVKTLDFIEWAFSTGHITKDVHMSKTNMILDQYKYSVEAYPNDFPGIDLFAQRYGLTDCKLGINRLKQGNIQIGTTENRVIYFLLYKIVRNSMESYSKIQ